MYGQYSDTPRPYRTRGDSISGATKEGKRARTVFANGQLAHVWAQRNQSAGRSNNGNFSFEGARLYSYNTPIAEFHTGKGGAVYALITNRKFSVSTSGHVSDACGAVGYRDEEQKALGIAGVFHVPFVTAGRFEWMSGESCDDVHRANVDSLIARVWAYLEAQEKARLGTYSAHEKDEAPTPYGPDNQWMSDGKRSAKTRALDYLKEAFEYADAFGGFSLYSKRARNADIKRAEELGQRVLDRFARMRAERETPAYQAKQAKKEAAKAEAFRPHLESATARFYLEYEAPGKEYPEHIARVYAGYDSSGVTPNMPGLGAPKWRILEGEELETARATWRRNLIDSWANSAAKWARESEIRREKQEAARRQAIRDAEKNADRIQRWKAGERISAPNYDASGGAYFRVVGDELESSMGARVPVSHAIRVFRFVKQCRETGKEWRSNGRTLPVGHFRVSHVRPDGSFVAGCHSVFWPAVEEAARLVGCLDEAGADTTEGAH